MEKSPDAFRTISEVAEDLDLPQHVLRFWETRFTQIRPMKRGGGRRYYRPDDIDLLRAIRHLLYGEGYTIKGVQRILKEQGPKALVALVRQGGAPRAVAPPPEPAQAVMAAQDAAPAPMISVAPIRRPPPPAPVDENQVAMEFLTPLPPQPAPAVAPRASAPRPRVARDDLQKLQSALLELMECRKILENARAA